MGCPSRLLPAFPTNPGEEDGPSRRADSSVQRASCEVVLHRGPPVTPRRWFAWESRRRLVTCSATRSDASWKLRTYNSSNTFSPRRKRPSDAWPNSRSDGNPPNPDLASSRPRSENRQIWELRSNRGKSWNSGFESETDPEKSGSAVVPTSSSRPFNPSSTPHPSDIPSRASQRSSSPS